MMMIWLCHQDDHDEDTQLWKGMIERDFMEKRARERAGGGLSGNNSE